MEAALGAIDGAMQSIKAEYAATGHLVGAWEKIVNALEPHKSLLFKQTCSPDRVGGAAAKSARVAFVRLQDLPQRGTPLHGGMVLQKSVGRRMGDHAAVGKSGVAEVYHGER